MNVSELARNLRIPPWKLLEILPKHGFDIGARAVKIDDRVANQIMKQWKQIKRSIDIAKQKEEEERKQKEKEQRRAAGQSVILPNILTVKQYSERLNLSVTSVIKELMKNGILANQNQNLDYDSAAIMAEELGYAVTKEAEDEGAAESKNEAERSQALVGALSRGTNLQSRPPVVVVMGHVDHGKTKLLDTIRSANIIDTEAGGITQHIGAYQTIWKDPKTKIERALTFIDTPGHEAFTVMRSRGAKVADIAILVVAADDGVKPQTEEVIQIIKAAKLPLVVAINKIDKDTADPQRVRTELSGKGVQPEEWGGDVPMVEISAKNKINIDKLLDVLLLVADLNPQNIQADPAVPAVGTIIEARTDKHVGPVATVLVQSGTLKKNDPLVVNGEIYGKVRAMRDYLGKELSFAGPATPVRIIGWKAAPLVGDILDVGAAEQAEKIDVKQKKSAQTGAEQSSAVSRDESKESEGAKKTINVLIKADVLGSLEAIIGSLENLRHAEVAVKIIGKGLGNITESDIGKAEASGAAVIGFHVNPTPTADQSMRDKKIEFLRFDIIYDLIKWVQLAMEKMLEQEKTVTDFGRLFVAAIFRTDKRSAIVGGRVEQGKAVKDAMVRIIRAGADIGRGKAIGLKVGQQEMKEVAGGTECGVQVEGKTKIVEGDLLEFYSEESKIRKIVF